MDTKDLRYFRQVCELGSINQAARQLFITPQGLSRAIRRLEQELNTSLFERSPGGMVSTESGKYLYENCIPILEKLDEMALGIRQLDDRGQKVRIGFSCGVLNVFPFQKMREYRREYGHVIVQWEEASNQEILCKLRRGDIDIGFVIGQITDQELWSIEVFQREMNVVVYEGHPFYDRESLSVGDLREEQLITLNEKYYSYHSLLQRCLDFGFTPNIVVKTMESQLIYQFCRQKIGLGIDADIHKNKFIMEGLRLVGLHDSIPWTIFMAARADWQKEPALREMIRLFLPDQAVVRVPCK